MTEEKKPQQEPDAVGSELSEKLDATETLEKVARERDIAISMLAYWCAAINKNGSGWDDWDEHYKNAAYRPCELRERLDAAIAEAEKEWDA